MRIGELARRAGVNVQTVRYYERLKLLRTPDRSYSGYRNYEAVDLERVQFIRRTQELGFSLEEIRGLVRAHAEYLHPQPLGEPASELRFIIERFEQKEREIVEKIGELARMRDKLRCAIEQLLQTVPVCPVSSAKIADIKCPAAPIRKQFGLAVPGAVTKGGQKTY